MTHILEVLINASEKAAIVARSCCEHSNTETLVVAEKCETEANIRFEKDFKTIADVLAQEAAKSVIISHFSELSNHVRGEESPEIGGISITLQDDPEKTSEMLQNLLPLSMAKKMAAAAHSKISYNVDLPSNLPFIDPADLGVWIDPIDGTAEFISGVKEDALPGHGLPCVTVLIGAYLRSSGKPIVGVINQPFYDNGKGRIIWGICHDNVSVFSENDQMTSEDKMVLMSGSEKLEIINKFKSSGWLVKYVPGAGHKLMKVALGEASAYIVSQGTTFRWDTCSPHSIILAKGGNIVSYKSHTELTYNDEKDLDTKHYCNKDGIIAYSSEEILNEIKNILSQDTSS
ncbi:unnamed protein product, partial [Brenthis ino]